MRRSLVFVLTLLVLVIVLITVTTWPPRARSFTPTAWTPLATSAFLPIDPLVRPIRSAGPGSAGSAKPDIGRRPGASSAPSSNGASKSPSTPPTARPTSGVGTAVGTVKGSASFYAYVPGGAAAAARLRDAIGPNWRGRRVTVWYGKRHVSVVLSDFERSTIPGRLIDLNEGSFAALVGPGWHQRGRVWVEVTW